MTKNIIIPALAVMFAFNLSSCNGEAETETTNTNTTAVDSVMVEDEKQYVGIEGLSIEFLDRLKAGESTDEVASRYAALSFEELEENLSTDEEKLAFWMNTYNGFIQRILLEDGSLYEDRGEFFKKEQVEIAGVLMSFDEIEHGIIRSNQWKLAAGYLPAIREKHVRKLKTDTTDGRIHLALNCGAVDCPAIAIYKSATIDSQLDKIAANYLSKTTVVEGDLVKVTPLMSWFRGDFGGKNGIKEDYLLKYGIIDQTEDVELEFIDYDWTLALGNYTEV